MTGISGAGAADSLMSLGLGQFGTIMANPPWRFFEPGRKDAADRRRQAGYASMPLREIMELPVPHLARPSAHLYLWAPNALVPEALEVMERWGFRYKTNLVWYKVRRDGGPDRRGVGFYFRNVTELVLFGTRGSLRTLAPGRRQVNIVLERKGGHFRKPDSLYDVIERCSPGPYLELFARQGRLGWTPWGYEI